jgi:hypothetical protein
MLIFDGDGDACRDSEYSNSWGFAAMIWGALVRRYAREIPGVDPNGSYLEFQSDNWTKLWTAEQNGLALRPWERDALRATYDYAVIRGADLERMAESFERFEDAHAKPGLACSLKLIAARMRELAVGERSQFTRPDVCFIGTSCGDDLWYVHGSDDDGGHPYNVKRDKKHWYVDPSASIQPGRAA